MIKLVAFDMDGTILDEESRLSQESLRTIERLLDRGIAVASNSGRSIRRSQEPLAPWPDVASALYVGGYNGGVAVSNVRDGRRRLLHEERLDAEDGIVRLIADLLKERKDPMTYHRTPGVKPLERASQRSLMSICLSSPASMSLSSKSADDGDSVP